jgi:hypothetical protein
MIKGKVSDLTSDAPKVNLFQNQDLSKIPQRYTINSKSIQ